MKVEIARDGMEILLKPRTQEKIESLLKDIRDYDTSRLNDRVLGDDWRIVNAWWSSLKNGKKIKLQDDMPLTEKLNLRFGEEIFNELVKRGKHDFNFDQMKESSREFLRRILDSKVQQGIILPPPHGRFVYDEAKALMVRSKPLELEGFYHLVSGNMNYGYVRFGKREEVGLEEFDKLKAGHKITDDERRAWWPNAKKFYTWEIREFISHSKIRKYDKKPGSQVIIDRVEGHERKKFKYYRKGEVPEILKNHNGRHSSNLEIRALSNMPKIAAAVDLFETWDRKLEMLCPSAGCIILSRDGKQEIFSNGQYAELIMKELKWSEDDIRNYEPSISEKYTECAENKYSISINPLDVNPDFLKGLSNLELSMLHSHLHRWSEENGVNEDVVNAHAFLVDEMTRREMEHRPYAPLDDASKKFQTLADKEFVYLEQLLEYPRKFAISDPDIELIGSVVVNGRGNDWDVWFRDWPQRKREFRFFKQFPEELAKRAHPVYDPSGPFTAHYPLYRLVEEPILSDIVSMEKLQRVKSGKVSSEAKESKRSNEVKPFRFFTALKGIAGYRKMETASFEGALRTIQEKWM